MELERIPDEKLHQVSGGLTDARVQELDTFIQRCQNRGNSLQTAIAAMIKNFFGNQNSVCRPLTEKWNFTVDRLKKCWGIE